MLCTSGRKLRPVVVDACVPDGPGSHQAELVRSTRTRIIMSGRSLLPVLRKPESSSGGGGGGSESIPSSRPGTARSTSHRFLFHL